MDQAEVLRHRGGWATVRVAARVAWAHGPDLLFVAAVVLAPVLALVLVLPMLAAGSRGALINDRLVQPLAGTPVTGIDSVATLLAWSLALVATVAVAGARLGRGDLPLRRALRAAWRSLPLMLLLPFALAYAAAWTIVSGPPLSLVLGTVAFMVLAVAFGAEEWLVIPVGAALLAGWAVSLARNLPRSIARWLLVVPAAALRGRDGAVARARDIGQGRRLATLALLDLFMLAGWLWLGLRLLFPGDLRIAAPRDLLLMVVIVMQSAMLAVVYLQRREVGEEGMVAELAEVPAAPPRHRPAWRSGLQLAGAGFLVALPTLLVATMVAANPYQLPRWSLHESDLAGELRAAAWPAGQHPVIVTESHIIDCLDDGCRRQRRSPVRPAPISAATIGEDGAIVSAAPVRPDLPRLRRCTRSGRCTPPAVAPRTGPLLEAAVATVGGAVLVATARPVRDGVELALTRCMAVACPQPQVSILGTVAGRPRSLEVHMRPYGAEVVSRGDTSVVCVADCTPTEPGNRDAVAFTPDGTYGLLADLGPEPEDSEVAGVPIEAPAQEAQFVVARCASDGCHDLGRQWRLNRVSLEGAPQARLVVTADRRALVVQTTDRLLTATAALPP